MFNALNALSENNSLLSLHPWKNIWIILAICSSLGGHSFILYVSPFSIIFGVVGLSLYEWEMVLIFSLPVILIDELLKVITRIKVKAGLNATMEKLRADIYKSRII